MKPHSTHVAYSDESNHNVGRFRSIAVLSCSMEHHSEVHEAVAQAITKSSVSEFKWEKVRQARDRFAASKLLDLMIKFAMEKKVRIDVLIWDTRDSRHAVRGRDDIANLQRMYYHIYKNVLKYRWPRGATWDLYPDEQSAISWNSVAGFLDMKATTVKASPLTLLNQGEPFRLIFEQDFGVQSIQSAESHLTPLCQVADLFAGMAAFSYDQFQDYSDWIKQTSQQTVMQFEASPAPTFSNSQRDRFAILKEFNDSCQRRKLGIGLQSSKGLKTYKPTNPINFWFYEPQNELDKAPIKVTVSS